MIKNSLSAYTEDSRSTDQIIPQPFTDRGCPDIGEQKIMALSY